MDNILTVDELMAELAEFPRDAKVMIAVIKKPSEFGLRQDAVDDALRWDNGTDVEVLPLEAGEITMQRGFVYLAVELSEFDASEAQPPG